METFPSPPTLEMIKRCPVRMKLENKSLCFKLFVGIRGLIRHYRKKPIELNPLYHLVVRVDKQIKQRRDELMAEHEAIKVLKEKKMFLEEKIKKEVERFTKETGITVDRIDLTNDKVVDSGNVTVFTGYSVKIDLFL